MLGSECCEAEGNDRREAYTTIVAGWDIEPRKGNIAEAEAVDSAEGNMTVENLGENFADDFLAVLKKPNAQRYDAEVANAARQRLADLISRMRAYSQATILK